MGISFLKLMAMFSYVRYVTRTFASTEQVKWINILEPPNHQERLLTSTLKKEQLFLNETQQSNCTGQFNQALTEAMISADIPF